LSQEIFSFARENRSDQLTAPISSHTPSDTHTEIGEFIDLLCRIPGLDDLDNGCGLEAE